MDGDANGRRHFAEYELGSVWQSLDWGVKGSGVNCRQRPFGCFAQLTPDPFTLLQLTPDPFTLVIYPD